MKSIFEPAVRAELINRIKSITADSTAVWGKMNIYQMLHHCRLWEEMIQGDREYKQVFTGKIFGKIALRSVLKDEKPLGKSTPTIPELKITGTGDIEAEKAAWISAINNYSNFLKDFMHPFFGKMTKEQIGYVAYKHSDHHLRQFAV